jgi:23S rRNA-/tRNA-specific pseudouridylate synthase
MKLTRKKIRKLVYEAMYDYHNFPVKNDDVGLTHQQKISKLIDKDKTQKTGYSLVDALGGDSEEVKDYKKSQYDTYMQASHDKLLTSKSFEDWVKKYALNLNQREVNILKMLINPDMQIHISVIENEDHPDYSDEPYPEHETPRTHPGRYYMSSIFVNDMLKNTIKKLPDSAMYFGTDGPFDDSDALDLIIRKASGTRFEYDDAYNDASFAFMVWLMAKRPNMKIYVEQ